VACGRRGKESVIDPTHLHFTAVADVANAYWNEALVNELGLDSALLPEIVESTRFIGNLTEEAASDFGLPVGTPVSAGCGDTAASALGAGTLRPGTALDIAGTAGVLVAGVDKFVPDLDHRTLMTMRAALPGYWYELAYVSGAGQVVEWVCKEILGHDLVDEDAYTELEDAVREVAPGSNGLLMSPHFDGRVAPASPQMRGALIGLTSSHSRAHIARAALESIAFEYRSYLDIVTQLRPGQPIEQIIGSGGGTRSSAWNQIKADVLGVDYLPISGIDPGTRGAAIVAMVGLGHEVPSVPSNSYGAVAHPRPDACATYAALGRVHEQWATNLATGYRSTANIGDTEQ
jgi:xylulokinase